MLKANSLIILDVFPRDSESGFYGDLTRTVVRGKASTEQRKLWETVLEAEKLAFQGIGPGKSGQELQDSIKTFFKDRGYPIARRTIAKYREQLDIPVARMRKKI